MLAPWKKNYNQLRQHIKKQRRYFANKGLSSRFFSAVMYGCESCTIKKVKHLKIDTVELWCWRRLLSPSDCEEIQPAHTKGCQS